MQFGYVRTSLAESEPQQQIDVLITAGVDPKNIYLKKTSELQTLCGKEIYQYFNLPEWMQFKRFLC